jgi:4'-phosphopantetheinyl transferase
VGIDLEHVRPMPDAEHLVTRFFSAREQRIFQALPETQKQEAFFNCWTRKEAFLKATGKGLTRPLDTFDVSLAPGKAARLLSLDGEPPKTELWSLKTFIPAAGSVATLAVEGSAWRPVFLEYQPI